MFQRRESPTFAKTPRSPDAHADKHGAASAKLQLRGLSFAEQEARLDPARADGPAAHATANKGIGGGGGKLPHLDRIQASFGDHDLSKVRSHEGSEAKGAADALGAEAYASGDNVAFGRAPSLHTSAHEAAHVVQQQAGVHLKGGVGAAGDVHEQNADAVADRVVRGESAADLLPAPGAGSGGPAAIQKKDNPAPPTAAKKDKGLSQTGLDAASTTAIGIGSSSSSSTTTSKGVHGGEELFEVETNANKKSVGYDKAKGATYGQTNTTTKEDKWSSEETSKGSTLNYKDDTLTFGKQNSETKKKTNGDLIGEKKDDISVGVKKDGTISAGGGKSNKNADGSGTSESQNVSIGPKGGSASTSKGATDAKGNSTKESSTVGIEDGKLIGKSSKSSEKKDGTQRSTSMEGSIGDGQAKGKIATSGGQKDKNSVSASADAEAACTAEIIKAGPPTVVAWSKKVALGADVGTKVGKEGDNKGGKVGAKGYRIVKGTKIFADAAKAQKFVDNKTVSVLGVEEVDDAADAMTLGVGETQEKSYGGGMSAGVNGTGGGIDAGLSGGISLDSTVKVERIDTKTFHVTRTHKTDANGKATVGTLGISLSGSAGKNTTVEVTVGFDTSKDEGKKSLTNYLRKGSTAGPCTIIRHSRMDIDSVGHDVSIAGLDVSASSETSHGVETDAAGKKTKESWGGKRSQGWGMSLLGLKHKDSNQLDITEQDTDGDGKKEKYFGVGTTTEGTGGGTNAAALARATGTKVGSQKDKKSSGKWTITSNFTEDEIGAFCEAVICKDGSYLVAGNSLFLSQIEKLRDKLSGAKSFEKRAEALTSFVSVAGADGLAAIKKASHADNRDDITLDGDKYFTGAAGRAKLATQATTLSAQCDMLGVDTTSVASEAQEVIGYLEDKLLALGDTKKYQDLPRDLRALEIERTQAHLAQFKAIYARAVGSADEDVATKAPKASSPEATKLTQLQAQLGTYEGELAGAKDSADEWHKAARKSRWVHIDGAWVAMGMRYASAYEALKSKEASAYTKADKLFAGGQSSLSRGTGEESIAREHRIAMSKAMADPKQAIAACTNVIADLKEAIIAFDQANTAFADANDVYLAISKRWDKQADYKGYFEGYQHDLPKGQ